MGMGHSWGTNLGRWNKVVVFHKNEITYEGLYNPSAIPRKGVMNVVDTDQWFRIDPINTSYRLKQIADHQIPKRVKMLLLVLDFK